MTNYVAALNTLTLHSYLRYVKILRHPIDITIYYCYYISAMRYEKLFKTARNVAVIDYRKAHPELSLQEIGDIFSITRQRVYAILLQTDKWQNIALQKTLVGNAK